MSESYRDEQLSRLMSDLRAAVKPLPVAKTALDKAEKRLRFVLRVVDGWDAYHAERADTLIRLGQIEAANGAATMIFDAQLRADLLRRTPILLYLDTGARMAEAMELEREVLN